MPWLQRKDGKKAFSLKGRVQCNESARLWLPGREEPLSCRLRELNWLGFTVDQIRPEEKDALLARPEAGLRVEFALPREFGRLDVSSPRTVVTEYQDVVDGRTKLQVAVTLEEHRELENIREFISYRNRRFNRYYSSRRASRLFKNRNLAIVFLAVLALILLAHLALMARDWWQS